MEDNVASRVPPQSIEAEQAVLGSMLLDKDVIPSITGILKAADFYKGDNRDIFEAILLLYNTGQPVDIITTSDILKRKGILESIGGLAYLGRLVEMVLSTSNALYYAKIVSEKSILRELIKAASLITDMAYQPGGSVMEVIDAAEKSIFDIAQQRSTSNFVHISEVLPEIYEKLDQLVKSGGQLPGVPSGFTDLDRILSGFQNGNFIVLAARAGVGKSAFALNVALNAARKEIPVAIFSLEMSREEIVKRFISIEAMIDSSKLRNGRLEASDWEKLAMGGAELFGTPIYIDDNAVQTTAEMRSKCRKLKLEKGLGLVIVDYMQLMKASGRFESRQQEVAEISRALKLMAKELNVPVLALSQLSREAEKSDRPMLSNLRESGAIEQDADIVLFLHVPRSDDENEAPEKIMDCIIAKHRAGATGKVKLVWMGTYTKFLGYIGEQTDEGL